MTVEELRRQHQARPFNPFRIHVADGRSFDVDHPEFMSLSRSGRIAYVSTENDGLESIDLLLVTSLGSLGTDPKRGNGRRK